MTRARGSFVLLDDARPGGRMTLFAGLRTLVETRDPNEVAACLEQLRGKKAAGFLAYEAGHGLEPKLAPLARTPTADEPPLLWFGTFTEEWTGSAADFLPDPAGAWAGAARPLISRAEYEAALAAVKAHIFAGDIYQANLTFAAEVPVVGHPLALYAALRQRARAGHGAIVYTGAHWLLSLSPELFFTFADGLATTRPMKGTAPPDADPEEFRADPKQRAENLMIVDLLRNDLSRVARTGGVRVPALFEVETYPTLLQLTSTVTAELEQGKTAIDLLQAIYPCGSITGAPKIRAMEIIDALEASPRGAYCGAIGRLAPDGSASFNVAIRTLTLAAGAKTARLGLGSGIVADSEAGAEWRECLVKGKFVETQRRFDLIETMRFDPHEGVVDLDRHFARMRNSADALGFPFDRHEARNELQAATFKAGPSRVRLLLSRSGAFAIELRPLTPLPDQPVEATLRPLPVDSADFRLRHKTSDRAFYDEARKAAGAFEVIFQDADGFLTEGSFTNIFVTRGGKLVTPPLARGLLPGILRSRLLEEGKAIEGELRPDDLAGGFLLGNAVRGLVPARLSSGSA